MSIKINYKLKIKIIEIIINKQKIMRKKIKISKK